MFVSFDNHVLNKWLCVACDSLCDGVCDVMCVFVGVVCCVCVWFVIYRVMVDGLFVCVCFVRCVFVSFV